MTADITAYYFKYFYDLIGDRSVAGETLIYGKTNNLVASLLGQDRISLYLQEVKT